MELGGNKNEHYCSDQTVLNWEIKYSWNFWINYRIATSFIINNETLQFKNDSRYEGIKNK